MSTPQLPRPLLIVEGLKKYYPLRGGEQYNVVVTFHSRQQEAWGVTDGSKEEVQSYFKDISAKPRQLIDLPKSWRRWATADREPIDTWVFGRATILGDAAHPTTQYMAQGACMAIEDAVALRSHAENAHRALWIQLAQSRLDIAGLPHGQRAFARSDDDFSG